MSSDRYAVIGQPVDHSLSPAIHTRFAEQTGDDLVYDRIGAPSDGFAEAATAFFAEGGRGLNVTVPFKAEARDWCDRLSQRARRAGVVNTLSLQANGWVAGDNTDGIGLVRDLTDHLGLTLNDARILLLGAGGAARGILEPLLAAAPAALVIANRTPERAVTLANEFAAHARAIEGALSGCGFDDLADVTAFDLVINASAASLGGAVPPIPATAVAPNGSVYDLMYGDKARPFLDWGRNAGAITVADGLGMLIEQAAESFALWRGRRPDTAPVLAALSEQTRP